MARRAARGEGAARGQEAARGLWVLVAVQAGTRHRRRTRRAREPAPNHRSRAPTAPPEWKVWFSGGGPDWAEISEAAPDQSSIKFCRTRGKIRCDTFDTCQTRAGRPKAGGVAYRRPKRTARTAWNAGLRPAQPAAGGRRRVSPTEKNRGNGLERRSPAGTARRRRAESRIAHREESRERLGTPASGRHSPPKAGGVAYTREPGVTHRPGSPPV